MKKANFFLSIFFLLLINSCNSQNDNKVTEFESTQLINGIDNLETLKILYLNGYEEEIELELNSIDICWKLNDTIKNISNNRKYINKIKSQLTENQINLVYEWKMLSNTLDFIFLNQENLVSFEEIVYNIKISRPLFKKYLISEKQDWNSLDTCQSIKLYYDLIKFITTLPSKEKNQFIIDYYTVGNRTNGTD